MLEHHAQHLLCFALLPLAHGVGIHAVEHKVLQQHQGLLLLRGLADVVLSRAGLNGVGHQSGDALRVGIAQHLRRLQRDVHGVDDAPPQGVLDVVVDIGDQVGQAHRLPLQRLGLGPLGVADDAVAHLPGQVQPLAVFLQPLHHPQGLLIVGKAPGHDLVQQPLSRMSKGGVPQVVPQSDGLSKVLVQGQAPGDGAGDTGDLQGVGHAGAVVVPLRLKEHLGLVLQPPESVAVDDAVDVPLKGGADGTLLLRPLPPPGILGQACHGGQGLYLPLLGPLSQSHGHPPCCGPRPPLCSISIYDFLF